MSKQYALITGATSGIGKELAKQLAGSYALVIVGRNQEKLKATQRELKPQCIGEVVTLCCDLAMPEAAEFIWNECLKKDVNIHVLINNAGVGEFGLHCDIPAARVINMLHINILSLTRLCQLFGKQMCDKKMGYILNIASIAAFQPLPKFASYAASKSYVLHFSEALAKEMENYNVVVTCLSPGQTDTGFFQAAGIGNKIDGFCGLKTRVSAEKVAALGIMALFAGRLSVIYGAKNYFLANINRFSPRRMTAWIAKLLTKNT